MLSLLKRKPKLKLFRIARNEWELWLFVASLVTILGFIVQTHKSPSNELNYAQTQSKSGEVYDIRIPNNSKIVQDRLETGR